MGNTNQFGINTCHHNNKLDMILNQLHLFRDFPNSPINEYSDKTLITQILESLLGVLGEDTQRTVLSDIARRLQSGINAKTVTIVVEDVEALPPIHVGAVAVSPTVSCTANVGDENIVASANKKSMTVHQQDSYE